MIFRLLDREVLCVDIEASSIEEGSFPIEVGWCIDDDSPPVSFLISPDPGWDTTFGWSPISQAMHGITLEDLRRDGIDVVSAAGRIEAAFSHRRVVSDNPEFDDFWLSLIYEAAGISKGWTVGHVEDAYRSAVRANPVDAKTFVRGHDAVERAYPHPHRAGPDALRMAKKVRILADTAYRDRLLGETETAPAGVRRPA